MIFSRFISKRNKERMVAMAVFELLWQELNIDTRLLVPVSIKCNVWKRTTEPESSIVYTYFKIEDKVSKQLLLGALIGNRYLGKSLAKRFDIKIEFRDLSDISYRTDTVILIRDKCSGNSRRIKLPDYDWILEDDTLIDSYFDMSNLDELKNNAIIPYREVECYPNDSNPIMMVVGCPNRK